MPTRIKIERQRFEQVQQRAALQAVTLAANTRRVYFNAVAAAETERVAALAEEFPDYVKPIGEAEDDGTDELTTDEVEA